VDILRPHSFIRLRLQCCYWLMTTVRGPDIKQERRVYFKGYFDALFILWHVSLILPFLLNPRMLCSIWLIDNLGLYKTLVLCYLHKESWLVFRMCLVRIPSVTPTIATGTFSCLSLVFRGKFRVSTSCSVTTASFHIAQLILLSFLTLYNRNCWHRL
jgi:hypothetical protein